MGASGIPRNRKKARMSAEKSSEETNPRDTVRPVPVPAGGEQEQESPFAGAEQVPPWEL